MSGNVTSGVKLPAELTWLADAPLFIDADQLSRFSDIVVQPEVSPQRLLVLLTFHYLINHSERIYFVSTPSVRGWREAEIISKVPRALVFLSLPSLDEAKTLKLPATKLIPMAAEFTNGKIETLYDKLANEEGEKPPIYKNSEESPEKLTGGRREYWQWFNKAFDPAQAVRVIEKAVGDNGARIRWVDYRLPVTEDGETLHLHISPAGNYDTGTFAYSLIKRAYKHGLRLVGMLKSGPGMNVLAVYEK